MARQVVRNQNKAGEDKSYTCGECVLVTPVTKFHTLTVKDRKPTLGRCPNSPCSVLLSQRACPLGKSREDGV